MDTRGVFPSVPLEQHSNGMYPIICKDGWVVEYPAFVDEGKEDRIFQFRGNNTELPDPGYVVVNHLGIFHVLNQYVIGSAHRGAADDRKWVTDILEAAAKATNLTREVSGYEDRLAEAVVEASIFLFSPEGRKRGSGAMKTLKATVAALGEK